MEDLLESGNRTSQTPQQHDWLSGLQHQQDGQGQGWAGAAGALVFASPQSSQSKFKPQRYFDPVATVAKMAERGVAGAAKALPTWPAGAGEPSQAAASASVSVSASASGSACPARGPSRSADIATAQAEAQAHVQAQLRAANTTWIPMQEFSHFLHSVQAPPGQGAQGAGQPGFRMGPAAMLAGAQGATGPPQPQHNAAPPPLYWGCSSRSSFRSSRYSRRLWRSTRPGTAAWPSSRARRNRRLQRSTLRPPKRFLISSPLRRWGSRRRLSLPAPAATTLLLGSRSCGRARA